MVKAAVLKEINKPLKIETITLPLLDVGQVLVEVHASGICGAQIGEIRGAKGEDKYLPHLLGHEGGGIVKAIGPGVTHVKPGNRVVMHWRKGKGIEAQPPRYQGEAGLIGGGWVTTFNEAAVVSENRLTKIGDDIPFDIAALMGCAVTTGLGLVNNEAKLKIGQSIAVAGCGGVGLNVIQGAALVGGFPIIAIDIHDEKIDLAMQFGATHGINSKDAKMGDALRMIKKQGVDVFVDCTGQPSMIDDGYMATAPGGKMILVGQPAQHQALWLRKFLQHYRGKTMLDSQGGLTNPTIDIPRYCELYRTGKLKFDGLITHRFPLHQVNDALNVVVSGQAGRVILEMNNDN